MRDQLDDLVALHAVVERAPEVAADLVRAREHHQRRDSDQAAIALGEPGPLPDVAEHDLVGELAELREHIADFADGGGRRGTDSHANLLGDWVSIDSIMQRVTPGQIESPYAWARLFASLALMTLGGVAMYGVVVVLPAVQAEFGVPRADAALPYTLTR